MCVLLLITEMVGVEGYINGNEKSKRLNLISSSDSVVDGKQVDDRAMVELNSEEAGSSQSDRLIGANWLDFAYGIPVLD